MLELTGVRAGYGAINVLWDVSLTAAAGQLTAIIGPNGAGKTTLLRAIMGLLPLGAGQVALDGQPLHGAPAWRLAELGVAMVPEGRMVFRDMSVEENLIMGAFLPAHRPHVKARLEQAYATFPRLRERRRQAAGALSGGEAQMLALARGLMSEPRLLIVDEPSLGLAPLVVNELFEILAGLKAAGRTIILVEQNTERALAIADHVYLMQSGKVALSRPAREVDLERLHELYFGR
ncbi:MAG TPA: ABC transporter ATP-binding protein [Burkholderiaceae bacterium]|nr:ABC transporter ATP-binding protein [Burkholderiaceae bacterium]